MHLIPLVDDVWTREHIVRSAGVRFPGRMTVVRLASGEVWLHSPVPIDDEVAAELEAVGSVTHIIAPNPFHYLFATQAKERYPGATLWAPMTLQRRRKKLTFDATLEANTGADAAWSTDLDYRLLEVGPKQSEAIFYHRASETLILTDLVLNFNDLGHWWTRSFLKMFGGYPGLKQSKLWRWMTKDRDRAKATVEEILAWPFERVIMSHGDLIDGPDSRARLSAALWWMQGAPKP